MNHDIAIVLPAGADTSDAVRIEIDVVRRGCDLVPENGATVIPSEVIRPLGWTMEEATTDVGDLVPAHYGFAARLRRVDCTVSYAGCAEKTIEEDGEGSITIPLLEVNGAACLPTATCEPPAASSPNRRKRGPAPPGSGSDDAPGSGLPIGSLEGASARRLRQLRAGTPS